MTNEQIKQNAEEYYQKLDSITIEDPREPNVNSIIDAYTAGAHSRDEEIKRLENRLALLNDDLDKALYRKEKFRQKNQRAQQHIKYLQAELKQLRNPWISVEERLPDIGQKVITITNKGKMLLVARTTQPPHKEEGGWRWEHYIGKVTHWMPIPKLEKGE
jgi:septal ring factor EnvC (AmiA/AmiB activator)